MKQVRTAARILMIVCLLPASAGKAQDVHFAQVQDMNTWYNPALKINKIPQAHINIRSVNYPNIIAYTSKAATIELPLIARDKEADDIIPFMNFTAGINAESSGDRFMNVSTAMMAFSYAVPLNDNGTCLAAGFQGMYTFSKVGLGGFSYFPNQFDKYGAIAPAIASDPFQSGYSNGYFSAGAGAAIFHNEEVNQWYIGGSIRHLNQPYTEYTHSVRLPANKAIQAGYTTGVTNEDAVGAYGIFSWQGGTREQLIGVRYTRSFDDSTHSSVSFGSSYRMGDAVIPDIGLKVGGSRFSFHYEFNIFANYNRRAFEFSYLLSL